MPELGLMVMVPVFTAVVPEVRGAELLSGAVPS